MTLASCIARNITKSERHVESAFRLVNHPLNRTPMWDGLLPSADSTTFLGPRARSSKEPSECAHQFQSSSPRRMPLVENTQSIHAVTPYRTCAQTETTLQSTRRRLRSQATGPLRSSNVLRLHPTPHRKTLRRPTQPFSPISGSCRSRVKSPRRCP